MEKSESIALLTAALIKAQSELEIVSKDTKAYNYMYAALPAVFAEYTKHFLKYGLVVIQSVEGNGLRTTLAHTSGEWVSSVANLMPIKNDPQAQGSAITYMRRYAMGAICGIISEEDDDAKKAMPTEHKPDMKKTSSLSTASPSSSYKTVIGPITDHSESGEWHKFTVNGLELSTKTPIDIETMILHFNNSENVSIDYSEITKGKWTNRYIKGISLIKEEGDIPF